MATTESPTRSHLDFTFEEFERTLAEHGHDRDEIRSLWDELTEPEAKAAAPGLGMGAVIALYLGLLFVEIAFVSVLWINWHGLGAWGILALGVAFLTASLGVSEVLRRKRLPEPAGLLEAIAVGWVGLVTYAVERLAGIWPAGADEIDHVHIGITVIAAAGLAAALLLMAVRPEPLLIVPLALAGGVLTMDLAELAFGNDLSERQRFVFFVPLGLAWIAGGLALDVTRRRDYAMWAHWVGLLTLGTAVLNLIPTTVAGFALVGVLGAISLFTSALVRHTSFIVVGGLGVLIATRGAMSMLGGMAPLFIAAAGLALVVVGLRWSRWRDRIRTVVLAHLPAAGRSFIARLAP